jgi:hypothetical protein
VKESLSLLIASVSVGTCGPVKGFQQPVSSLLVLAPRFNLGRKGPHGVGICDYKGMRMALWHLNTSARRFSAFWPNYEDARISPQGNRQYDLNVSLCAL